MISTMTLSKVLSSLLFVAFCVSTSAQSIAELIDSAFDSQPDTPDPQACGYLFDQVNTGGMAFPKVYLDFSFHSC